VPAAADLIEQDRERWSATGKLVAPRRVGVLLNPAVPGVLVHEPGERRVLLDDDLEDGADLATDPPLDARLQPSGT